MKKFLKESNKKLIKNNRAITLISLIVTIIILLILVGVTLSLVTGSDGILGKAEKAVEVSNNSSIKEEVELAVLEKMTEYYENYDERFASYPTPMAYVKEEFKPGNTNETSSGASLEYDESTGKFNYIKNGKITSIEIDENGYTTTGENKNIPTLAKDGSWSDDKKVNTPKLEGTGLTAVYWNGTTEVELTEESSAYEWYKWYDYSKQKWANAVTKDENGKITGYWVWIPRYAYQITSGCNTSTAGEISVKFLQGTTNKDADGNEIATTYPTVTDGAMQDYVVHPVFTDGSTKAIPYGNGEWDKEIAGFWVAKYPAGFQASTINSDLSSTAAVNATDTIVYSGKNYTNTNNYTINAIGDISTSTAMSYPVFKPLTYAYNCITIGDSYTLAQEVKNGSSFYGLSSSNTDSHMMKNSEWGAVAYLTQSSYGRSGAEVNANGMNLKNLNSKNIYALTGVYSSSTSAKDVRSLSNVYTYNNTTYGVKGSSTGNISGVYDLSGCIWESVSGYITNGNSSLSYGSSLVASTTANENGYQTLSTKYATVYPYDSSSDSDANNWTMYNSKKTSTYGYGDAILEVATAGEGSYGWNGDYSHFPFVDIVFFTRGGVYNALNRNSNGVFSSGIYEVAIQYYNNGFRVVLVCE